MAREKLGEILIRSGYLTQEGLQQALNEQERWGGQLGRFLVELGLISEEVLVRALSAQFRVTAVALEPERLDIKTAKSVPQEICERHNLICFRVDPSNRFVDVALSDPHNLDGIDEVRVATQRNVRPFIAAPTAIDRAIRFVFYGDVFLGGDLDLSPDSKLRLDSSSELLRRSRLKPGEDATPTPAPAAKDAEPGSAAIKLDPSIRTSYGEKPPARARRTSVQLPAPEKEGGFHITMDVPAVDKKELSKQTFEDRVAELEAVVTRNSALIKGLFDLLASRDLLTSEDVQRILEKAKG